MPTAVIFGAGSVGRGFIAQILSEADYAVTFIDVDQDLVAAINQENRYLHLTVSSDQVTEQWIEPVCAVDGRDRQAVIRAVCDADLAATAVGAQVLPKLAETIAAAIRLRLRSGKKPLNILLCENLHHAAAKMQEWLLPFLEDIPTQVINDHLGLLETSIGRMIPVPTPDIRDLHPAAVQVEPYKYLPFDHRAVRGTFPEVPSLVSADAVPFAFFSDRKLYIHNMGHAVCAYLARFFGYTYIWESIADPQIRYFVRAAMLESAVALAGHYNQPLQPLIDHIDDLLFRFSNRALADTVERVGRDPRRKLAAGDRLWGACQLCDRQNARFEHILLGLAAAYRYLGDSEAIADEVLVTQMRCQIEQSCPGVTTSDDRITDLLISQFMACSGTFSYQQQIDLLSQRFMQPQII